MAETVDLKDMMRQAMIIHDALSDFLGIDAMYQQYADKMDKAVTSLTGEEKRQAFFDAILDEVE